MSQNSRWRSRAREENQRCISPRIVDPSGIEDEADEISPAPGGVDPLCKRLRL